MITAGGSEERTALYRVRYVVLGPALVFLKDRWPKYITTTERLGQAMLVAARQGAPKRVLESRDINRL